MVLLGIMLLLGFPLSAQTYPGGEFFGGASFASANVGGRADFFGWQISAAANPLRCLRLVGDFGGQHRLSNLTYQGQRITLTNYQVLFGPQWTRRSRRTTLFANTVAGVAATHYGIPSGTLMVPAGALPAEAAVVAVDFGFATSLGAGMDVNTGRFFAIRVFQADYVLTHLSHDLPQLSLIRDQLPNIGHWQHSFRLGFGLVFKLGQRSGR